MYLDTGIFKILSKVKLCFLHSLSNQDCFGLLLDLDSHFGSVSGLGWTGFTLESSRLPRSSESTFRTLGATPRLPAATDQQGNFIKFKKEIIEH